MIAAAHGDFELYDSIPELSKARILNEKGVKVPVFVRFSTVLGSRGSPDTVRDARGFAVKFYTQEGNWDLVGNNIPVFFIQDGNTLHICHPSHMHDLWYQHMHCVYVLVCVAGVKFPDLVHAAKPENHNEIPQVTHTRIYIHICAHTYTHTAVMFSLMLLLVLRLCVRVCVCVCVCRRKPRMTTSGTSCRSRPRPHT